MILNREVTVSVEFKPSAYQLGQWFANQDAVFQARMLDAMAAEMKKWGICRRDSQIYFFLEEMRDRNFLETLRFGIENPSKKVKMSEYDAMPRTDEEVDD